MSNRALGAYYAHRWRKEREMKNRYLVLQLNWLQGQGKSVYLDVASVTDTRESAEAFAEENGGFVIPANWWPGPDDPRRTEGE